jgi:hypothetical protein
VGWLEAAGLQLAPQPGAGEIPFPLDGSVRNIQDFGCFFDRQSRHVSQLDNPGVARSDFSQTRHCVIQDQEVHAMRLHGGVGVVEGNLDPASAALGGSPPAQAVDQNIPHHFGRQGIELAAASQRESLIAGHAQPRFMNQRSRLKDGVTALMAQSGTAEQAQLAVHDWDQFLESALITGAPPHEKLAHVRLHDSPILVCWQEWLEAGPKLWMCCGEM